tara:strand:+ start:504 stop:773 length:270 start_codon:yes stop_codon:yes gene_type:complete
MALTKATIVDKAETVKIFDHYCIQIRERKQILEDGVEISSSFHRYVLNPDHDVSTISDATVKAQFNAVMTDEIKANYAKFLKEQEVPGE